MHMKSYFCIKLNDTTLIDYIPSSMLCSHNHKKKKVWHGSHRTEKSSSFLCSIFSRSPTFCVMDICIPQRSEFVLSSNIPDSKVHTLWFTNLSFDLLTVKPDCRYSVYVLLKLSSIKHCENIRWNSRLIAQNLTNSLTSCLCCFRFYSSFTSNHSLYILC